MLIDYKQLNYVAPKLRKLLTWLEKDTGLTFTTTSQYRINDKGVHGQMPLRGWDLRMRNKVIGKCIVRVINTKWSYDPARPKMKCAILHGEGSNLHIHLQVHPKTVAIK